MTAPTIPTRARHRDERGVLTAEAALVVPVLVLVAVIAAWAVSVVGLRLQAIDGAREAARLAARGETVPDAVAAARSAAPAASAVDVAVGATTVRARVAVPVLAGVPRGPLRTLLSPAAGLTVTAESVAARELLP